MPRRQQNERSALTLLALLDLKPSSNWQEIDRPLRGITPIMEYTRAHYGREYAPNTRETLRRQTMHQFVEAGIALYNPDDPARPVNSPNACYQASEEAVRVIWVFRRKWNTESGGSGTSIPEEVEQRIREVEHGIRRKWNIDSGGSGTAVPEVVNARR